MLILADITLTKEQQSWVALAIGLVCVGYLLFRPKFRKKKDPLEKAPFSSLAQQRTVERQMQNLLVELSEMTRQLSAQLDTRAAKLEQLIKDADERIARLGGGNGEPAPRLVFPVEPESHEAAPPSPPPPAPAPAVVELDPRHAEIYSLADEGRDAREIAAKLNRPSGEVELILALRPRA